MDELRFSKGWKFYSQGLSLAAFGILCLVCGVVIIVVDPLNWVGVISMLGGAGLAAVGAVLLLIVWLFLVVATIGCWRVWRQLRPPTAVVDADGVRYLATRRPATVPWSDIEQVKVDRTIFPKRVVSSVSIRLVPGTVLRRAGHTSEDNSMTVGLMSDLAVPEDSALAFLTEVAGPRLEITDDDRRSHYEDRGYR